MDNEKDMREPGKQDHEVSSDDSQEKIVDGAGNQEVEEERSKGSVEQDHSAHEEAVEPTLEKNDPIPDKDTADDSAGVTGSNPVPSAGEKDAENTIETGTTPPGTEVDDGVKETTIETDLPVPDTLENVDPGTITADPAAQDSPGETTSEDDVPAAGTESEAAPSLAVPGETIESTPSAQEEGPAGTPVEDEAVTGDATTPSEVTAQDEMAEDGDAQPIDAPAAKEETHDTQEPTGEKVTGTVDERMGDTLGKENIAQETQPQGEAIESTPSAQEEGPAATPVEDEAVTGDATTPSEVTAQDEMAEDGDAQPIDAPVAKEETHDTQEPTGEKVTGTVDEKIGDTPGKEKIAPGTQPKGEATDEPAHAEKAGPGKELHSEEDLAEKHHHHDDHDDDHEEVDYTSLSKEELVDLIKSLAKDANILRSDRIAKQIRPLFDEIKNNERAQALERFLQDEGNSEEDFEYKYDELVNRFDANYKLIKDRKSQYTHEKEQQKEANLVKKQEILEKLREFVDADDPNVNFEDFKKIQDEWKNVGPIPGAHVKTLWANYNALVDRFYDNRSIYFELKELDRRKNLGSKLELCERAEKLANVEHIKDAITELNELHHEFKHIGPVPKDDQEPVWQRFKAASDAVYDRRKGFVEQLKVELDANLKVKEELADAVQPFTSFDSDRIKEWNSKTKELLDIQKRWEATGGLPRNKAKEVNKKFWGAFKAFFNNKGNFFKKLDAQRVGNMEEKRELVKRAQELKDSEDWNKTADAFKELQRKWKEIGPVPEKFRESIYQEFKEACDHFFDNRRKNHGQVEKEFEQNYERKLQVCAQITAMADEKSEDIERFRDLQEAFNDIGFVPRKNISDIKAKYAEAVEKYINSLERLSSEERQSLRAENQINRLIGGPNPGQKIHRKEQSLRKQISQVENDIAVWKNNMEFFAESKKADKLKDEFQSKINSANSQLKNLKEQLKILRTVS